MLFKEWLYHGKVEEDQIHPKKPQKDEITANSRREYQKVRLCGSGAIASWRCVRCHRFVWHHCCDVVVSVCVVVRRYHGTLKEKCSVWHQLTEII